MKKQFDGKFLSLILVVGLALLAGCTSIPQRETVSVAGYASMRSQGPRSSMEQINMVKLRMDRPPVELLGPGDVLGIYISTVTGSEDVPPPVYNVDGKTDEDPATKMFAPHSRIIPQWSKLTLPSTSICAFSFPA